MWVQRGGSYGSLVVLGRPTTSCGSGAHSWGAFIRLERRAGWRRVEGQGVRRLARPRSCAGRLRLVASVVYVALRRLLAGVVLRFRSREFKELEIVVLRHELEILRRQTRRPRLRPADRVVLAAACRVLPRCRWRSLFVRLGTLMRWHRDLVARRWTYSHRSRLGGLIHEYSAAA
jgi:hypothetical protein